jgi:hypothetical protein
MLERKLCELQAQALSGCFLYLRCWVHFLYWASLPELLAQVRAKCVGLEVLVCQAVKLAC